MATIFETRLIGNIGKDAVVKLMDRGILAINFPGAHNKNWKARDRWGKPHNGILGVGNRDGHRPQGRASPR